MVTVRNLAPQWNKAAPARGVAEAEKYSDFSPSFPASVTQWLNPKTEPVPWGPSGIQHAHTREMGREGQERTRG